MNSDLISREALKKRFKELHLHPDLIELIDNAPSINPCDNCNLYFKATTKEIDRWYKKEEQKGGAE